MARKERKQTSGIRFEKENKFSIFKRHTAAQEQESFNRQTLHIFQQLKDLDQK